MNHVRMTVEWTLIGPILTQATSAGPLGLDAVMARTHDGKPYLPYSQVRGKLRQALEELADKSGTSEQKKIHEMLPWWLGLRSGDDDRNQERGALCFSDFVHPKPRCVDKVTTRIKIDDETGAAQEKMMLVVDTPFAVGEEATFVGEIRCMCATQEQANETIKLITAGLKWIRQIGAERTTGHGRVKEVNVATKLTDLAKKLPAEPTASAARVGIRLRPRGPFCVAGQRHDNNVFESETIIPGNVILGALATTWALASGRPTSRPVESHTNGQWNHFAANFTKLIVSHLVPCKRDTKIRPCAVPLSLVAAEPWEPKIPDKLFDVALCTRPRLITHTDDDGKLTNRPAVFQPDWKKHVVTKCAREMFGWTDPKTESRVRTSIDSEKLRAADEQLFGYQMVVPDEHDWLGWIDFSEVLVPHRDAVRQELRQLLAAGLGPLGKTKIDADIEIFSASEINPKWPSNPAPLPGNRWVVTLQTPAVLCHADALRDPTGRKLHAAYEDTFRKHAGVPLLKLERFFAKQSLAAPRFAGGLPKDANRDFYPFILTEAGSTFVLSSVEKTAEVEKKICEWLSTGLPLAQEFLNGEPDWKHCPYLHRHGYGEIAVNPPWLSGTSSVDMPERLEDESP